MLLERHLCGVRVRWKKDRLSCVPHTHTSGGVCNCAFVLLAPLRLRWVHAERCGWGVEALVLWWSLPLFELTLLFVEL